MFPKDYRRYIISYLKNAITKTGQDKFYQEYFGENKIKPYTFSVYMQSPIFQNSSILIPGKKIAVIFSTSDKKTNFVFANAFVNQMNKTFDIGINKMTLDRIEHTMPKAVRYPVCLVRAISPVVVREHDRTTNKNNYVTIKDSNFEPLLNTYVHNQLKMIGFKEAEVNSFSITPLQCKSTSAVHYGSYVFGTVGIYEMKGSPKVLTYLANSGIGALSSCGFGTLDLIEEQADAS